MAKTQGVWTRTWNECTDSLRMIHGLYNNNVIPLNERKIRLFACGYCRHLMEKYLNEDCFYALEQAEHYADGNGDKNIIMRRAGNYAAQNIDRGYQFQFTNWSQLGDLLQIACSPRSMRDLEDDFSYFIERVGRSDFKSHHLRMMANFLRCVFGNPWREMPPIDPSWMVWNDGTIKKMAQVMYEERAFDRMPILADALEDAGCTHIDILSHCRWRQEHVRGCWVVDLLLEKK